MYSGRLFGELFLYDSYRECINAVLHCIAFYLHNGYCCSTWWQSYWSFRLRQQIQDSYVFSKFVWYISFSHWIETDIFATTENWNKNRETYGKMLLQDKYCCSYWLRSVKHHFCLMSSVNRDGLGWICA